MQATSNKVQLINWSTVIMFVLGFWLSSSLILDCLIVPGMLTSGMMKEPGFASAGYLIFGAFNHLELLAAGTVLAGCLVYQYGYRLNSEIGGKSIVVASVLLMIALAYTYVLTPQMSGMGMTLDLFATTTPASSSMAMMHVAYWALEATKLVAGTILLRTFFRNSCRIA